MQNLGGQTKCIMGNSKIENSIFATKPQTFMEEEDTCSFPHNSKFRASGASTSTRKKS